MSVTMWVVGSVIFAVYMYFTIWNINNGSKPPPEREDASYDVIDMDGMGNFSHFPAQSTRKVRIKKRKKHENVQ